MNDNRKIITLSIKIVIGIACFGLIGQRLYSSYSPESFRALAQILAPSHLLMLLSASALMTLNWGIEVKKWTIITFPIEQISFGKAWQSVWTGVCIGNLTPGRLGEFAGRILYYAPANRAKVATSHFVCGITQMVVTIVFGCIGLLFYSGGLNKTTFAVTLSLEFVLLVLLIVVLMRVNRVVTWILNLSALKKYDLEGLSYNRGMLVKLVAWSVLRYFIFSLQFFLILRACGINGDAGRMVGAISIMYLVLSSVPMISVIEVGVRAYVAVILFGMLGGNDWQLTVASTLLWFINIALPSGIGYFFILKNNFSLSSAKNGVV